MCVCNPENIHYSTKAYFYIVWNTRYESFWPKIKRGMFSLCINIPLYGNDYSPNALDQVFIAISFIGKETLAPNICIRVLFKYLLIKIQINMDAIITNLIFIIHVELFPADRPQNLAGMRGSCHVVITCWVIKIITNNRITNTAYLWYLLNGNSNA